MREADLYPPIKAYLQRQGYEVKGEVGAVDIMARRGDEPPVVVELKLGFSLALFHQAVDRLTVTDQVYIAVPRPKQRKALTANLALCKRIGVGLLTVRPDGLVEAQCDPGQTKARRNSRKSTKLLRAFDRLDGDPNAGGATRHGIVTGYRQDALKCARYLVGAGADRGANVAKATGVKAATTIMRANHYGWFEKVETGVYGLTAQGRQGLKDWADALD